ncbi:MAG: BatA domain-containing protein [Chlorobi bacterium]|nr:BatA domain-containing protein [Chlorobiota bacterium]
MLWGLAAVSIPIIIHIFNLKKTKKIEFSTLMFLKEIQQSKYKRIKLKQLLILLCRIAFIILLVLAFSRPFDKGYFGNAGEIARSSVLIILDDSFSMSTWQLDRQAIGDGGNNLDKAKEKINETLNLLDENDEVFFTTVSQINKMDRQILFKDINALRDNLNSIKTSDITKNLSEVLYFTNQIMQSASHLNKEIFLFTDGQKTFFNKPEIAANEFKLDEQTKFNIILTGSRTPNNLSVDTINTVTKIFERRKSVKLNAVISNYNNYNVANKSIILNYGNYKDEKAIDVPANSSVEVEFILIPNTSGFSGGYIELLQSEKADDEISGDNKRYFAFYVPEKVSLLLVSNSAGELEYINLALASSEELMTDSLGNKPKYFNIKQINSNELASQNLMDFDAVVLVNKPQFTNDESAKLNDYIENGGGVILYPGNSSVVENYNEVLLKKLNLPYINSTFGSGSETYKFDKIDFLHPILEGIFKNPNSKLNIESPNIKSGINLTAGENSVSIITLNNEKSFSVEYSKARGKLIMFAVSPDMAGSDYPSKNIFSPITVRSILYLANINNIKEAVTGRDYFVDLNNFQPTSDTLAIFPGINEKNFYKITIGDKGTLLNINQFLNNTSNYKIKSADKEIYELPCNFDKLESSIEILSAEDMGNFLKDVYSMEANIIKNQEVVSVSILELRTGKEMWHYSLFLALLFLTAEYLLARSFSRKEPR